MKTKPCLFLILFLLSILFPLGSFAQTDKFTASWNFSTGNSRTQTLACSESDDAIYVESNTDNVKLIVEANGQTITSETGGLKFSPGVILKMPVNNPEDEIGIEISGTLNGNYRIYAFDVDLLNEIHPDMWTYHFVDDGKLNYKANEVDAGYGYIGIEILKETTIKSITANLSITTAYTYYDEAAGTFYFKYDDKKFTHDPATVGNLNSQYEEVNTSYEDEGHFTFCEHLEPYWSSKSYDAKKVVFEDNFINYVNNTKPLKSCYQWFQGFTNLTEIQGLDEINTREVNDMSRMFLGCRSLTQKAIQPILNKLNFSKVQLMTGMFQNAFSTDVGVDLEFKDWNATNVLFVKEMFRESGVKNLKITNFGGNKINDMRSMFYQCQKLESVEFDGWKGDDGVFADANAMFCGSPNLQSVKLSGIHLGGDCGYMFKDCTSLTTVDMSEVSFGRSPFSDIFSLSFGFQNCSSLKDVKINGDFNFLKADRTSLQTLFRGCPSIEVLDLRTWDTKSIDNLAGLFGGDLGGGDPNERAAVKLNTIFVSDKFSCESETETYNWMFRDCISLIGGNGYRYPYKEGETENVDQAIWSQQYAHVDEDGNPGFFTYAAIGDPLRYKIFYDLNGGKLPEGKSNPKEFAENDEVTLVNPEKEGYVFAGWTGTSATGLSADIPTEKDITIKKGSRGNRWYYAHWETGYSITFDTKFDDINIDPMLLKEKAPIDNLPEPSRAGYEFKGWKYGDNEVPKAMPAENITLTAQWEDLREPIEAELNGEVSFPASADNYCNGSEKTVTIDFKITRGEASEFKLSFPNDVIPAVNGTIEKNGEGSIVITIPDNIESGVYTGKVLFVSANPEMYRPFESTITITANIPRPAAVQLYTDMLLADNHDGNFASYQWYKDGNAISGATLGHYYEATLSGKYTVKITTTDGKEFMSCPVKLVTAKAQKQSVKVYPNPAKKGETLTIEIENYTDGGDYTIKIFSSNGSLVKQLTAVSKTTQIALPSGIYSGSLINGGEKSGFKLIVE